MKARHEFASHEDYMKYLEIYFTGIIMASICSRNVSHLSARDNASSAYAHSKELLKLIKL